VENGEGGGSKMMVNPGRTIQELDHSKERGSGGEVLSRSPGELSLEGGQKIKGGMGKERL